MLCLGGPLAARPARALGEPVTIELGTRTDVEKAVNGNIFLLPALCLELVRAPKSGRGLNPPSRPFPLFQRPSRRSIDKR